MRIDAGTGESSSTDTEVDVAIATWRRRTGDILLVALALGCTPLIVEVLLDRRVPLTSAARLCYLLGYAFIAAAALLRRTDIRVRLAMYGCAAYLSAATGCIAAPRGGFGQVGPIAVPVILMVLAGQRAARFAALFSALLLIATPLLRRVPAVENLMVHPSVRTEPPILWIQVGVLLLILAALVALLDYYHRFLLRTLAAKVRATLELQGVIRERRQLERTVAVVADRERQRLGHDMHDGVCQQLTAALLRCQSLKRRAVGGEALSGGDFDILASLLGDTVEEAHNVAVGLCPLDSDPGALAAALGELANRVRLSSSVRCEFRACGNIKTPDPDTAQHLYRIAQEAVSNAMRHAHASCIRIELHDCGAQVLLVVEDDGVGLPAQTPVGGMGLRTMTNRARLLDGELTIGPAAGGGVRIACRVLRDGAASSAGQPGEVAPQQLHA